MAVDIFQFGQCSTIRLDRIDRRKARCVPNPI